MTRSTFSTTPLTRAASALSTVLTYPSSRSCDRRLLAGRRLLRESMGSVRQRADSPLCHIRFRDRAGSWTPRQDDPPRSFAEHGADDLRAERGGRDAPLRGVLHDHG